MLLVSVGFITSIYSNSSSLETSWIMRAKRRSFVRLLNARYTLVLNKLTSVIERAKGTRYSSLSYANKRRIYLLYRLEIGGIQRDRGTVCNDLEYQPWWVFHPVIPSVTPLHRPRRTMFLLNERMVH